MSRHGHRLNVGTAEPLPTRWSERVFAATSFYAAFRPPVSPRREMVSQYTFWPPIYLPKAPGRFVSICKTH